MDFNMDTQAPHDPQPPIIYLPPQPPSDEWGAALIVACLALGFVTSWAVYEMHSRISDEINVTSYRHDLDLLIGQQADLGRMLADPRTMLVRLIPVESTSRISVAWNQQSQSGAVFSDDLAAGNPQPYEVWLIPSTGQPTAIRFGPTRPGRSIYPFISTQPALAPIEIDLTLQTDGDQPRQPLARGKVAQQD